MNDQLLGARLLRAPEVQELKGCGRTKLHLDVVAGTWPPPVKRGARWAGWPADECIAVNRARIAGADDDEVRTLVRNMVEARQLHRAPAGLTS